MLKALLVDDEIKNLETLQFLLHNDCDGIKVIFKAQNTHEARDFLKNNYVDVIFLDILMPGEDGFQFLENVELQETKVVFVTAYSEYALRAIKASAVDYLLKPINISELQQTVEKLKQYSKNPLAIAQHHQLLQYFKEISGRSSIRKIAVPQLGSIRFVELDEIVSLQADSNYTIIHLKDMQKMVITKTLGDFEEILNEENNFIRIHKSYIVNLAYVKEYATVDGGVVKMIDGNQWSISRRQLESFLDKMRKAIIMFGKPK